MCIGYIIRMEFVTLVADVSLVENVSGTKKFAAAVRAPSSGGHWRDGSLHLLQGGLLETF